MRDTAFQLALGGIASLFFGLILILAKWRLEAWFLVSLGINFFVQSYMVVKNINLPYIAIPNLFLVVYAIFVFLKWFRPKKEQKP